MVFSLALRVLRDRAVAEELAQDVFLQFYRQLDQIETPQHAVWWLRRTTSHRAIDELRKRKYRPVAGLDRAPEPADRSGQPDLFLNQRLRKLVDALPDKARMIVVLRYQEDLSPMEIAEMLEMPVATVKSLLHRSLTALRGKIEKGLRVVEGWA